MLLVRGLTKGRIGNTKSTLTTKKVHAVDVKRMDYTVCINHVNSESLGIPFESDMSEVNCRRCLQRSK